MPRLVDVVEVTATNPCRASQCICEANSTLGTRSAGKGTLGSGFAITWYMSTGTGRAFEAATVG